MCGCSSNFVDDQYNEFFGIFNKGRKRGLRKRKNKDSVTKKVSGCGCSKEKAKTCFCDNCVERRGNAEVVRPVDSLLDPTPKPMTMEYMGKGRRKVGKNNFVESDDFLVHDESTFDFVEGDDFLVHDESTFEFSGSQSHDVGVDDVENGDDTYDYFLTKKMRERRRVKKELMEGGLTRQEAKAQALEQVPRTTIKEAIAKLKSAGGGSVNNVGGVDMSGMTDAEKLALLQSQSTTELQPTRSQEIDMLIDSDDDENQAGFIQKNGMWLVLGAVVVVGGYFAYKKFGK